MLRRFARVSVSLAFWAGDKVCAAVGRRSKRRFGLVLYYHAIGAKQRASFARQVDLLCRQAKPWAVDAPVTDDVCWIGLTFDDAYLSVWENAVPELVRRRIPFAVFVPTGSLGQRPSWIRSPQHPFWQERVMSAEQLRELGLLPGASLGSHTVTHPRLSHLSGPELDRELRDSRAALEDLTGRPVELLSFPHGDWNERVVERAWAAGYRRLFGIEPVCFNGSALPPVIGRVAVQPDDSPLEFLLKVRGCYRWAARRGKLVQPVSAALA